MRIIGAIENLFCARAISAISKLIYEWRHREWRSLSLAEVFPIAFVEMIEDFGRNFDLLPFRTRLRICFWVTWDFDTSNTFTTVWISKRFEFTEQFLDRFCLLESSESLCTFLVCRRYRRFEVSNSLSLFRISMGVTIFDDSFDVSFCFAQFVNTFLKSGGYCKGFGIPVLEVGCSS